MLIDEILKSKHSLYLYLSKEPSIELLQKLLIHREHYQLDLQIIFREVITNDRKIKLLESIIKLGSLVYYLNDLNLISKSITSFAIIDFQQTYDLSINYSELNQEKIKLLADQFYLIRGNSELISKEYFYKFPLISFYTSNSEVFAGTEVDYFWQVQDLPTKVKVYLWVNNQPAELNGTGKVKVNYKQLLKLRVYSPNEFCFTRVIPISVVPNETISFFADRQIVFCNDNQAVLYWQCPLDSENTLSGVGNVPANGQQTVQLTADTNYTLTIKSKQGIFQKNLVIKYSDIKQNQFVNVHITAPIMTEPKTYPIASQLAKPNYTNLPAFNLAYTPTTLEHSIHTQQLKILPPSISKLDLNTQTSQLFSQVDVDLNPTKILNNVRGIK